MKPKVTTNCVANRYTAKNERIVEFTAGKSGGLIFIREFEDGSASVQLYRLDPMTVTVSFDEGDAKLTKSAHGAIITPA